jgi:hypothetical protein
MNTAMPSCVVYLLEEAHAQAHAKQTTATCLRLWAIYRQVGQVALELAFDYRRIQAVLLGRTALDEASESSAREQLSRSLEIIFTQGIDKGEVRPGVSVRQLTGCFLELCSRFGEPGRDRGRDRTFFELFWRGIASGRNARCREAASQGETGSCLLSCLTDADEDASGFPQSPFFAV